LFINELLVEKMNIDTLDVYPSCLEGEVSLSGAKNSVLKLLAASLLTEGEVTIENFPASLSDAQIHVRMLEKLGKECVFDKESDTLSIKQVKDAVSELEWSERSIRNTLLILGALFAKTGTGSVPQPGGCKLGDRKYDIHLDILKKFGAKIFEDDLELKAVRTGALKATDIRLPMRSTGATENAILIGCLAEGNTNIWNPHIRPEVIDLITMLNKMGAKIQVKGQERIVIKGVSKLSGVKHRVIADNMEALTWTIAASITNGFVEIKDFPFEHLEVPLVFLRESGCKIYRDGSNAIVKGSEIYPLEISTGPYPGINSDMQPLLAAYAACAHGHSTIVDLRFLGRYAYASQFSKMNVESSISNTTLQIMGRGRESLVAAEVEATDLRAGISLALLGLACKDGVTRISNAWQIERGYCYFKDKLRSLGAEIS